MTAALTAVADPRSRPDPEDPSEVLAMAVLLHIERADPPARSALLAAAASAALAVCTDGRAEPGGPWHDAVLTWCGGRIRKVARRARGAHWAAVGELDGITVEVAGAQARALVPGPVGALDPRVRRLQISGTELEADDPTPVPHGVPVLWVASELEMSVGKAAAQVGHASMLLAASLEPAQLAGWRARGWACAVREASAPRFATELARAGAVSVRDAGYTEVPAGSLTVVTRWP